MSLTDVLVAVKARAALLWADDTGAVISAEYALVGGVLVSGVVPGLVAARNGVNAAYVNMGNTIQAAVPAVSYNGYQIGGANGGSPIAAVGGQQIVPATQPQSLTAVSVAPAP